jgi:hypothetical protein
MEKREKEEVQKGSNKSEEKITLFKKIRAAVCHHCPFCSHARKNPDSAIGKILHHRRHADNCPLWKAEIEVYGGNRKNPSEVKALMFWKAL